LGIELTTVGEEGTVGEGDREENEERGVKDGSESQSFSRSGGQEGFEDPAEVDGEGEGYGKKKLKKDINLLLLFRLFYCSANDERTDGFKNQPVCQDDAKGEFISQKGDEEFPQENDLGNDSTQTHHEEGDS